MVFNWLLFYMRCGGGVLLDGAPCLQGSGYAKATSSSIACGQEPRVDSSEPGNMREQDRPRLRDVMH